jgi:hypothetical protein
VVHLISYDLNRHERPAAYADVRRIIEQNATAWRRPLYSQWLVETSRSVTWWRDLLKEVIDEDDNLLVVRVTEYEGWLSKDIWPWLRARV